MSNIDHIFLYLSLFFSLSWFQRNSRKIVKLSKYVLYAVFPVLLFTFIEGCRYGRGADYFWYKYRFEYMYRFVEPQVLFGAYEHFLGMLNANYIVFFMCNSLLFITILFGFLKKMFSAKEAGWMYLLAVCALLYPFETFVRQYLAFPFLLLFIAFLMNVEKKKDYAIALVMLCLMNMIHSGLLFGVPFILLFHYGLKKAINGKIAIFLFFLAYFVIPNGFFADVFAKYMNNVMFASELMSSDASLGYIENSAQWLSSASILANMDQSMSAKLLQFFFESAIAFGAYEALRQKPNEKINVFFNMFVVGCFFTRIFWGYEIFSRMFNQLYVFWFIPAGYIFYSYRNSFVKPKKLLYSEFIIVLYLFLYWSRNILFSPMFVFAWNV